MKYFVRHILLLLLCCLMATVLRAQEEEEVVTDSIEQKTTESALRGSVHFYFDKEAQVSVPQFESIDTAAHNFQNWDPAWQDRKFRNIRGNQGMTVQLLEFERSEESGFKDGIGLFDVYRFKHGNTPFYQVESPYTSLYYANDPSGKVNLFDVTHAQNVGRGLNFGLEYRVQSSEGTYQRMGTKHNNFRVFGNYFSKNQKYRALAGYYRNKFQVEENGGIANDSLFISNDPQYNNHNVIPVNLNSAKNTWVENSFYLKQTYHLVGGNYDSLHDRRFSLGYLSLSHDVQRYSRRFTESDLNPDFYPTNLISADSTFDSNFVFSFRNRLAWSLGDPEKESSAQAFKFALGVQQKYTAIYSNHMPDKIVNEFMPFANLRLAAGKHLRLAANYQYILNGDNQGDYDGSAKLSWLFNSEKSQDGIKLSVGLKQSQADWFMRQTFNNHYYWQHSFEPEQEKHAGLSLAWKGIHFSADYTSIDHYIYLSENGPRQASEPISVIKLIFDKNFKLAMFNIDNRLVYQQVSNEDYLHLPLFMAKQSYYINIKIVKTALLRIGVDLTFKTAYYADLYNPALGCFTWQDKIKTGNYVYIDPFLNFNIKRANIFVKYQHLNDGWMGYDYFSNPHYPSQGGSIQYGVRWRFYD